MTLYKNKYRVESIRLQSWDYGWSGAYFITICCKNRVHFFGNVLDSEFIPSKLGQIANDIWLEIPKQFPFITLDAFVIMPDHIHGILILNFVEMPVEMRLIASPQASPQASPESIGGFAGNKSPMFHNNISRVIRWYKGRCSFEMGKIQTDFGWQSLFYDHIIRENRAFENIQNYIINNPTKWNETKN